MFTPEVIWMMIGGSAIVVFGAGRVVKDIQPQIRFDDLMR